MNKKVFTVDGLELAIKRPTAEIRNRAKLIYNKAWKEAVVNGSMLKRNIDKEAEELGLWGNSEKEKCENIKDQLRSLELKLRSGASSYSSKEDAKADAFKMRELRAELLEVNRAKDELYPHTAESYADDAQLKYFISQCCINNASGAKYFKDYEDFISNSEGEIAQAALGAYFELMFSDVEDFQAQFYENKWLKDNGYVDDKYRLINADGKLVDTEGRLIDENGRFINEANEFVDKLGHRVDEDGNYVVDYVEF